MLRTLVQAARRRVGFTLIELLIVVAIIAILAAIAVPNFLEAQTRAKVSRSKTDMRSMATCIEAYHVDHNEYFPAFEPTPYKPTSVGPSVVGAEGVNGNGVSARLLPLTTPIAYCSSVFNEAFRAQGTVAASGLPNDDPRFYDTFDYVNAKEFLPGGHLGASVGGGSGRVNGGAWRLSSVGPDRIQAYGGALLSQGPAFPPNVFGAPYDPTNGTVSSGDIIRAGSIAPGEPAFYDVVRVYTAN